MTIPRTQALPGALLLLALAACGDEAPLRPEPVLPPAVQPLAELRCTVTRSGPSLSCVPAEAGAGGASGDLIVGGQHVYVTLASSNRVYDAGTETLTADVTVQNLIPQALGTTDGATLDPSGVRVFFQWGPTVTTGTGVVSVLVPTPNDSTGGVGTFTGAGQPYWQWNEVLAPSETSPPRQWRFAMPSTVSEFDFGVYVSAPVQYPDGWLDLSETSLTLAPAETDTITAVSLDVLGRPTGETVTWATADASVASVTQQGVVTGAAEGSVDLTASTPMHGPTTVPVTVSGLTEICVGDGC